MPRFIIRHLTGLKANQESAFDAGDFAMPLTLGRDPASRVAFDDADDAVSRQHARIERRGDAYVLIDAGSANGLFVNGRRTELETALAHGDIVQFGRGGPQASVQLDPPPPAAARATRLVSDVAARPTREVESDASAAPSPAADGRVGRATVERLITHEKARSTRLTVNLVAGLVAVVGALAVWQVLDGHERDARTAAQIRGERDAAAAQVAALESRANLSKRMKDAYAASTVFIEVSWRLTDTATGRQIYHATAPLEDKGNLPAYVRTEDGSYEPLLQLDERGKAQPIGGTHTGTGFVVSDNGMIMTNRHVAAAWHAPYGLQFPGVVVERKQNEKKEWELKVVEVLDEPPTSLARWVPSRSKFFRTQGVSDSRSVTGTVNSMMVTFANSKLRNPATLGTISPEHDVALIKVEASTGSLKKVEMRDSSETLSSGDPVVVLGYPGLSAKSYVVTSSSDTMLRAQDVASIPEVSVNQGIVSKVVRSKQSAQSGKYVSTVGDIFEMSINSTGQGNSGGPVFDGDGKVIGIFAQIGHGGLATQTGAVPIRYGMELLDPTRSAVAMR